MDRPLDEYLIALSTWEHVQFIRYGFIIAMFIGAIGFFYFWVVAVKVWFSGTRDAWKKQRGLKSFFWSSDLRNPFMQRFLKVMLKAFLVWLIPGWPLVLILAQLASPEAFNIMLGYEAISGPE